MVLQVIIALVVWQVTCGALIPTPTKVFQKMMSILGSGEFYDDFIASVSLIAQGMFISIAIAMVLAYLSLIPFFRPIVEFVVKCRYLTLTGLIFLFTLLSSDGHALKIYLLIFGIVPFFLTSLLSVIDGISRQEIELCKTLRMNNWQTLLEVVIRGRLDQAFDVMRQNFAIAWMMITAVEAQSMSEGGLGTQLIKYNKYIDLSGVFAVLIIIFIVGVLCDFLLGKMRVWLFPYAKLQSIR
ncbi:MAG: ABC transporter permease [Bacteroidia bacterium]